MISIESDNHLVNIAVLGEFTLADFKDMEKTALSKIKSDNRVNLLLDLRGMTGLTVDVAWEEIEFARDHPFDLWKIAVVTESALVAGGAWFVGLFTPAETAIFEDYNLAKEWITPLFFDEEEELEG